jgi:N-acetylglucosaminyldiphosphoundecaprenol N-acetyl-beta-D-mannosaminyltransferase
MDTELPKRRNGAHVLDTFVDTLSLNDALERAGSWTESPKARYVCFCNVHSIVTATVRSDFASTLGNADLVLPDGTPVAWTLKLLGFRTQKRISGPEFMWKYCELAEARQASVFLYGNRPSTLDKLRQVLHESFPNLRIVGSHSPPYRKLSAAEDDAVVAEINASGADIVFVSLGCPKQELWMASHRDRVGAVMLGVGAAFDYHAGIRQRPPAWVQNVGFEWLCRLALEPKRLWKRYLIANSIFVCRATGQIIDHTLNRRIKFTTVARDRLPQKDTASDRI